MSELTFSQDDLMDPGPWLESRTQDELKKWLRRAFWARQTLPVVNANAFEIAELLKSGSASLRIRVREVVPELVQEWGRDESPEALDDLLIVCGRLRCAGADVAIASILTERLHNQPQAVPLRQRCLAVLSGFGCTDKTVHIFERYLGDINYATICYPALYLYDLAYAASALPRLIKLLKSAGAMDELDDVIEDLAEDLKTHDEAVKFLINYLRVGERDELVDIVERLYNAGVFTTNMLLEINSKQRKQLAHLLLTRSAHATLPQLLVILKRVGARLLSVPGNSQETIDFWVEDSNTKRAASEKIAATNKLDQATRDTIVDINERLVLEDLRAENAA